MSLLLDSNVVVWWLENSTRLKADLKDMLNHEPDLAVSVMTPWELWIKAASGRLSIPDDLVDQLARHGISVLSPTLGDARLAASLPPIHRDPFDRMIVAQALNRRATIVTADRVLGDYGVQILLI